MLKTLITLTLLMNFIMAQDLETLYEDKQYIECIEEARKSDFSKVYTHFYWALCADKEGLNDEAVTAYERVLILDEDHLKATISLARLYNKLDMPDLAKELLVNVRASDLSPSAQNTLLALLNESKDLSELRLRVNMDLGYDSNVNISPGDNLLISGSEAQESLFSQVSMQASYLYDLEDKDEWYLKTEASLYHKNNFSQHLYDILNLKLSAAAGYKGEFYTLELPVFYERINYLDVDLLQAYGLKPELSMILANDLILNVSLLYSQDKYFASINRLRDSESYGLGLSSIYFFDANYLYFSFNYEDVSALENNPTIYTDRSLIDARLISFTSTDIVDFSLSYFYRELLFEDLSLSQDDKRKDSFQELSLALIKEMNKYFKLRATYSYNTNSSNYDVAKYDKSLVYFGIEYNY